jgi:hypothetical protein
MDLSKLSPLDHIKSFYKDSQAPLVSALQSQGIRDRSITRKKELLEAIQASPVPLTPSAAAAAIQGAPPQRSSTKKNGSLQASAIEFASGDERAEDLADAAARKSLESLEDAYNAANKRCDGLLYSLKDRELQINSLTAKMKQLEAEKSFIASSKTETNVLTDGHTLGSDPLSSPITASEAAKDDFDEKTSSSSTTLISPIKTSLHNSSPLVDDDDEDDEELFDEVDDIGHDEHHKDEGIVDSTVLGHSTSSISHTHHRVAQKAPTRAQLVALTMGLSTADTARFKILRQEIKAARHRIAVSDQKKQTMAFMTERLRRNADDFDRHLTGVVAALKASRKELNDVVGYLRVLEASRDAVTNEVYSCESKMKRDAVLREEKLSRLVREVEIARMSESQRLQREAVRKQIGAELRGDLSQEQEKQLLDALAANESAFAKLEIDRRQREERGAALQEAYAKIKASTGVTSLNSLAQRFLNSRSQRLALEKDKADAEIRLEEAKEAFEIATKEYSELRATGGIHKRSGITQASPRSSQTDDGNSMITNDETSSRSTSNDEQVGVIKKSEKESSSVLGQLGHIHHLRSSIESKRQEISVLSQVCDRLSSIVENIRLSSSTLDDSLKNMRHLIPAASRPIIESNTGINNNSNTLISGSATITPNSVYLSAADTLKRCEQTLNVLVQVSTRASLSYLRKSVASRIVPSLRSINPSLTRSNNSNKFDKKKENGAFLDPSKLSFITIKADMLTDAEILQHFQSYFSLPLLDGRPSIEFEASNKVEDEEPQHSASQKEDFQDLLSIWNRNSDVASSLTPGVPRALLDLASTASTRMLSTTSLLSSSESMNVIDKSHYPTSRNTTVDNEEKKQHDLDSSTSFAQSSLILNDLNVRVPALPISSSKSRRDLVRVALPTTPNLNSTLDRNMIPSLIEMEEEADGDDGMMIGSPNSPPASRGTDTGHVASGHFTQSTINVPSQSSSSTPKATKLTSSSVILRPSLRDKEAAKESNKSIALSFAAEADSDGLLDRRILKKLASTMNTIEEKCKAAEKSEKDGGSNGAQGKIDLQQAMARRASLARLMNSIATNAEQAFAGTFKSTAPEISSSSSFSSSSSSTSDGGDVRPGSLTAYTQKPRLR